MSSDVIISKGAPNFPVEILSASIYWLRSTTGLLLKPYETMRKIVGRSNVLEMIPIALLVLCYFLVASLVKTPSFRPYLLTKHFVVLVSASALGYIVINGTIMIVARIAKRSIDPKSLMVSWGYTLTPTVLWFLITSLLYVILPPPRTTAVAGMVFSGLYLLFSSALFFWKIMLLYLVLRFTLKAQMPLLLATGVSIVVAVFSYSLFMYTMGIFKVPFI
jgi:hypothetical protein